MPHRGNQENVSLEADNSEKIRREATNVFLSFEKNFRLDMRPYAHQFSLDARKNHKNLVRTEHAFSVAKKSTSYVATSLNTAFAWECTIPTILYVVAIYTSLGGFRAKCDRG